MSRATATTGGIILHLAAIASALLAFALAQPSPAAEPAASQPVIEQDQPAPSPLDAIELKRSTGAAAARREASSTASTTGSYSLWRVLLAMGVVLAAVFSLRWLGRRFLGLRTDPGSGGVIHVLTRLSLGPRQQLMLIQVGRRLVLAANSGAQINPLCEITDPEEAAQIIGQVQQRRRESVTNSFPGLIGRAGAQYDASEQPAPPAADPAAPSDDASAIVATTRQEITGLSDKIRALSQALRRA